MRRTAWMLGWLLAACTLGVASGTLAQEPPPEPQPAEPQGETPAAEAPSGEQNVPWWGGRNMLFLEFGYGSPSFEDIDTSVLTNPGLGFSSTNIYSIEDAEQGRFAVGWMLPYDRGRFVFAFNGTKENGYRFDAVGQRALLDSYPDPAFANPNGLVDWWRLRAEDGRIVVDGYSPAWDFSDDAPGGTPGEPDPSEVRLVPFITATYDAPDTYQNRVQTWDATYEREWGGRRYRGRWTAGGRYFVYEGNLPVGAWLSVNAIEGRLFYTDTIIARPLSVRQETTAFGPTASLEAQFGFFRQRLILYMNGRFAFLSQTNKADTGDFPYFVSLTGGETLILAGRSTEELDKSVWQVEAEVGARIRIAPGAHVLVSYTRAGYGDALLFPVSMTFPEFDNRIEQGVTVLYNTRDLRLSTFRAGLSYQF